MMPDVPIADTTPWTLWIPFGVYFLALAIAIAGHWLSRDQDT